MSDDTPAPEEAPDDEPSVEADIAVMESVASELAAIEVELKAMDAARDAD